MSDTPSPTPPPEAPKPRLSLTPKTPAAAAPAPAPAPEAPVAAPEAAATPPPLQASSGATPASLLAANKSGVARPSLKLSGTPHPSVANPTDAKFETAVADTSSDTPPIAIVALSGLAAVAALTFAALLFLKNQ